MPQFGKRFKELRLELGLSQAQVAARGGLNHSYIGTVERKIENPSAKKFEALARGLGLSPAELADRMSAKKSA
jgi:XRE family transcriptional regulator, regulator of sulfur utilization